MFTQAPALQSIETRLDHGGIATQHHLTRCRIQRQTDMGLEATIGDGIRDPTMNANRPQLPSDKRHIV